MNSHFVSSVRKESAWDRNSAMPDLFGLLVIQSPLVMIAGHRFVCSIDG